MSKFSFLYYCNSQVFVLATILKNKHGEMREISMKVVRQLW